MVRTNVKIKTKLRISKNSTLDWRKSSKRALMEMPCWQVTLNELQIDSGIIHEKLFTNRNEFVI